METPISDLIGTDDGAAGFANQPNMSNEQEHEMSEQDMAEHHEMMRHQEMMRQQDMSQRFMPQDVAQPSYGQGFSLAYFKEMFGQTDDFKSVLLVFFIIIVVSSSILNGQLTRFPILASMDHKLTAVGVVVVSIAMSIFYFMVKVIAHI